MFKNIIRDYLCKPIIWYLKYKDWDNINIIINVDNCRIEKRDLIKEKKQSELIRKAKEEFDRL